MTEELRDAARAVAAGIEGDSELRLETQSETLAWLEAAAAQALAALGSVATRRRELAALLEPRRRRRALARTMSAWFVLATVVLAFLVTPLGFNDVYGTGGPQAFYLFQWWTRYSPAFRASHQPVYANWPRDARPWHALWQSQPNNLAYLGYYADWLARQSVKSTPTADADLRAYLRRDPENAHPYYLLAARESRAAFNTPDDLYRVYSRVYRDAGKETLDTLQLRDRARLDQAMYLLREGMAQPRLHTYADEITRDRLRLLPAPTRFVTYTARGEIGTAYSSKAEYMLFVAAAYYARLLAREGHAEEAIAYLLFWRVYAQQSLADAKSHAELRMLSGMTNGGAALSALVYREMGREELARRDETDAKRLIGALTIPSSYMHRAQGRIAHEGGLLAAEMMYPFSEDAATPVSSAELSIARRVEYLLREQRMLAIFLFFAALLLIGISLLQGLWSLAALGGDAPVMRLLPPARCWAPALGLGVVLPLAGYWWFANYSGWAGRNVPEFLLGGRFTAQAAAPLLLCLLVPCLVAAAWARRRWRALGLPAPVWPRIWGTVVLALFVLGCLTGSALVLLDNHDDVLLRFWFALVLIFAGALLRRADARLLCLWVGTLLLASCVPAIFPWYGSADMLLPLIALILLYMQVNWRITVLVLGVFALASLIAFSFSQEMSLDSFFANDLLAFILLIAIVMLAPLFVTISLARRRAFAPNPEDLRHAAYHASVTRAVLPVLAGAVLTVLLLAGSYLVTQEIAWLKRDTVLVPKGENIYSPAYLRATAAVKARAATVLRAWE
ncbi:MAG: hypothetical protein BWY76_01418 [bacterium ADurb.Bin429]|nr:MAG: hypothetical protein BWY76_01418 [bacterium ADurb.Bin429]